MLLCIVHLFPILFLILIELSSCTSLFQCNLERICHSRAVTCEAQKNNTKIQFYCTKDIVYEEVKVFGKDAKIIYTDSRQLEGQVVEGFLTYRLTMRDLFITRICPSTFQYLGDVLEHIDLVHNRISSIHPQAFNGLKKLKILNLSLNHLEKIPIHALGEMATIQELYISGNRIKQISKDDFVGMPRLLALDVSFNKITSIASESIGHLMHLVQLQLGGNEIQCNCDLAWLRFYQKCFCVLNFDNCSLMGNNSKYSLVNFPADQCEQFDSKVECPARQCEYIPNSSIDAKDLEMTVLNGQGIPDQAWGDDVAVMAETYDSETMATLFNETKSQTLCPTTETQWEIMNPGSGYSVDLWNVTRTQNKFFTNRFYLPVLIVSVVGPTIIAFIAVILIFQFCKKQQAMIRRGVHRRQEYLDSSQVLVQNLPITVDTLEPSEVCVEIESRH